MSTLKGLGANEDLSWTLPLPLPQCSSTSGQSHSCPVLTQLHSLNPSATPSNVQEPGLPPAVPHSASAFLGLILPRNILTPQPAEPTPPSPTIKGRFFLYSKSTGLSCEAMRCPFPQTHRCWTKHPFGFAGAPTPVIAEMEVLPPILLSTEETLNEKSDLLLFYVKTEPTGGVGEIKKRCISIATVSYDNREA